MKDWRKTGRPPQQPGIPAAKLLRCLKIIQTLKTRHVSINELAANFDINVRTAYRYLKLFEEVGLYIEKDFDNKFFIVVN